MQVVGFLICVTFVVTIYAADNKNNVLKRTNWEYTITDTDYVVGYDEPSQSLSFYNSKMGVDLTFDGNKGVFGVINTTTGGVFIIDSQTQYSQLVIPSNKDSLLKAFASKNNTNAFKEAASAVSTNADIVPGKNTFNMYRGLAGRVEVTKRDNDHLYAIHGKNELLTNIRYHMALLLSTCMTYIKTNPFRTHNGVLLLLAGALTGPAIVRHDFTNLLDTVFTYLKGQFNKDLMDKVASLIEEGQNGKFSKNVFNSLAAAISLVGPYTTGLDLQVAAALHITY